MEKIKVLIADDMQVIAECVKQKINENDKFEVIGIANNGEEEYNMILTLKPDIVFTDNKMPYMNGIDVIEKIKKLEINNKPKFVLLTSQADRFFYTLCAELDIIAVISKPISYDRITQIMNEIIDIREHPIYQNTNSTTKNSIFTKLINIFKGGN